MSDLLHRFLMQDAPVRGELVCLESAWHEIASRHDLPQCVRDRLGELGDSEHAPRKGRGSSLGEGDWRGMGRTGLGQMASAVHGAPERHGVSGPPWSPQALPSVERHSVRIP